MKPSLLSPTGPGSEGTAIVGVDENGNRVGEDHPRAKLTDHEVELIRELYETRAEWGGSARKIAEKFEVSKSTVVMIANYQRRATTPVGWRTVRLSPGAAQIASTHVR